MANKVCHYVNSYVRTRYGKLEYVSAYWRCCGGKPPFGRLVQLALF